MLFKPIQPVYKDMPMWAARLEDYSFIISEEGGVYSASVRRAYTTEPRPVRGQLIDLGAFESMTKAIEACERWRP